MASGCTVGIRYASGGNMMHLAMLCWEILILATHLDFIVVYTYQNIFTKTIAPPSWKQYSLMAVSSVRGMLCIALYKK